MCYTQTFNFFFQLEHFTSSVFPSLTPSTVTVTLSPSLLPAVTCGVKNLHQ